MKLIGSDIELSVEEMLNSYLPKLYYNSKSAKEINRVDAIELEKIYGNISEIFKQFFVETATWGLTQWEKDLDITTVETDSYELRRSRIKSKLQSFQYTFTEERAVQLANNYLKNKTAVLVPNYSNYEFTIEFESTDELIGFKDMLKTFELYKPAHLKINFEAIVKNVINIVLNSYFFPVNHKITICL